MIILIVVLLVCCAANQASSHFANAASYPERNQRIDCHPELFASRQKCEARGCFWLPALSGNNMPWCVFPANYSQYDVISVHNTTAGIQIGLEIRSVSRIFMWKQIRNTIIRRVKLSIEPEQTSSATGWLRITFRDAEKPRWEVPIVPRNASSSFSLSSSTYSAGSSAFTVEYTKSPFSLIVTRASDSMIVLHMDWRYPLILADQLLQFTSGLHVHHGYGLGEHRRDSLAIDFTSPNWQYLGAMWARDQPPAKNINLYGTHPFLMGVNSTGATAFGLFVLNSNAQEFAVQPEPSLTYRSVGGVLDLFLLPGPRPHHVAQQYTARVVGRPSLPPFWSMGFHLCRYGYRNTSEVWRTVQRNLAARMPLDVQWTDIDYMDRYVDWTVSPAPAWSDLSSLIRKLRDAHRIRYVVIMDAGVSTDPARSQFYREGLEHGLFINQSATARHPLVGRVWPGNAVFPDFTNPAAVELWAEYTRRFLARYPVDGLWIDMNEPSNFVHGSLTGCDPQSKYVRLPYTPRGLAGNSLADKTLCPEAAQRLGPHYDLHNMFGYYEAAATKYALENASKRQRRRAFVLSRSTFAGSGVYTAHWTGDNLASWQDLRASVQQMLNFNLFGVPMVGADICGFRGNPTEELCVRWMQLGAFYPFMRNHAEIHSRVQDPAVWSNEAQAVMRHALRLRYALLAHLYTQMVHAHMQGTPPVLATSWAFPEDAATTAAPNVASVQSQFVWGAAGDVLVVPCMQERVRSVSAYLPANTEWYPVMRVLSDVLQTDVEKANMYSSSDQIIIGHGNWREFPAPLHMINVFLRAGRIFAVFQPPFTNTDQLRKNPINLEVLFDALPSNSSKQWNNPMDKQRSARGTLFWDDGESIGTFDSTATTLGYNQIEMTAQISSARGFFNVSVVHQKYVSGETESPLKVSRIRIHQIAREPARITLNGSQRVPASSVSFDSENCILSLTFGAQQPLSLYHSFQIDWN